MAGATSEEEHRRMVDAVAANLEPRVRVWIKDSTDQVEARILDQFKAVREMRSTDHQEVMDVLGGQNKTLETVLTRLSEHDEFVKVAQQADAEEARQAAEQAQKAAWLADLEATNKQNFENARARRAKFWEPYVGYAYTTITGLLITLTLLSIQDQQRSFHLDALFDGTLTLYVLGIILIYFRQRLG